ncbi:MAG: PAS domain S-box protein [Syntrophobacteraceae bacterium]
MPPNEEPPRKESRLRLRTEELLRQRPDADSQSNSDLLALIHELDVHKAELEIQNEELRRAQREISELHREYEDLYEFAPCGYVTLSPKGVITRCNLSGGTLLGAERARLTGVGFSSFVAPERRDDYWAALKQAGESGEQHGLELKLIGAENAPLWVLADVRASRTESGAVSEWRIVLVDTTERKKAEEEADRQRIRLTKVFDSSPNIMLIVGKDGRVKDINRTGSAFSGRPKGELQDLLGGQVLNCLNSFDGLGCGKNTACMDCPVRTNVTRTFETGQGVMNAEGQLVVRQGSSNVAVDLLIATVLLENDGEEEVLVTLADITERKRAEEALRENQAKLEAALVSMADAVFISDARGQLIDFNDAFTTFHRFRNKEECSRSLSGYPEMLEVLLDNGERVPLDMWVVPRALRGETVTRAEYTLRHKETGETWNGSYSFAPIRGHEGEIVGAVVVGRDITDRKRAERALRLSEEKSRQRAEELEKLMDLAPIAIFIGHDPQCHNITGNRAALRIYEADGSENLTASPAPGQPAQQRQYFRNGRVLAGEELPMQYAASHDVDVLNEEVDVLLPSGRRITLLGSASPLRESSGRVRGCVAGFMDITERKKVAERLRKSEERFRELAENIREVFWVRTPDEMLYISPAFEEIWGRSCESIYKDPNSFIDLVLPEDRERVLKAFNEDINGVAPFDEEYRILRPDGDMRWIWARSFPILEQGIQVRTVGIAEDITARKEAEEFLRIERDLALGLGSAASLTDALEVLLEACINIDDLDCGGIYLVERETGTLRLICHHGLSAGFVERVSLYEPISPQARFVMQGEPGYWSNPIGILGMGNLLKNEGLKALASIPVKSDGEVVALLNVSSHIHAGISFAIRSALESIASHIGEIIARVRLGETIKTQNERLEETNAALRVLLRQRENDRADLEESFVSNVKHLVLPYLDQLKGSRLTEDQRHLFEILESHLREITSPFVRKISSSLIGLTPTEIRVAELIRQGKSTKEIAELLMTSESTVVFHRQGVRRKLGLIGKSINLQTYLASLL